MLLGACAAKDLELIFGDASGSGTQYLLLLVDLSE